MMGTDNRYPDVRLGSTNGNKIGIATTAGSFQVLQQLMIWL
jgi:hypothetical protein